MKRLIFLLLFLLSSIPIFSQSFWWVDTTTDGKEKKIFLGRVEFNKVSPSGKDTMRFAPLPVNVVSGSFSVTAEPDSTLRAYLHPSDKIIGATDSVTTDTTVVDVSSLTTYGHLSVYAYGDIYVSLDETVWIPVIANTSLAIENFSPVTFNTIYIRRKAVSGTVLFDYTIIGY